MAIIRYLLQGDPIEAAKYQPLAKKWALALLQSNGRQRTYPLPDGGTVWVERTVRAVTCWITAGTGPWYQFLCPTPTPHYDRISVGGTPIDTLTGSAVAVDLRKLPKDTAPLPEGAILATGTSVEAPPEGVTQFPRGTLANQMLLQKITWQVDGLGAAVFAPSNRRDPPKTDLNYGRALLTPWFVASNFVGNLAKLSYQYGPGLGDWGYDIPPARLRGQRPADHIMEPDADWPNNAAYYVTDAGARFVVMLAADFTLHAWSASAPLEAQNSPYASQGQAITLSNMDVRTCAIPVPDWASVATTPFRDQVDPGNIGDLPSQPRPQGHFRHDGRRLAALLYRRQPTTAHLSMREEDPVPADHNHKLAFEDHGLAQVVPNPGYSEAPFATAQDDATGWAEWEIAITTTGNGDFTIAASLAQAQGPDDTEFATKVPVAIGYADPHDWANSGAPGVATGDLLLATLHLYSDTVFDQFNAWHTGGLIGDLRTAAAAYLTITKVGGSPITTLNLFDRRGFAGISDAPQLLNAARDEISRYTITLYALDLSKLAFLAVVNQYQLTANTTALSHHSPTGYPITAAHTVHALSVAYGAVVATDELADQHPSAADPETLLFATPDLTGLTPLPTGRTDRTEVAIFHVDDSGLAHWTKHVRVTEETPVPNGSYPNRLLYRLYPSDYDLSDPKTPNRSFHAALSLLLDDYQSEIEGDAIADFGDWKAAILEIVETDMADYLNARFPRNVTLTPPGNPFGYDGGMEQIAAALDYWAGVNQTRVDTYNKLAGVLVDAGLYHDDYRFRPFALTAFDANRWAYNAAATAALSFSTALRIGMDGWIAISAALLVPTQPYRTHRAYWYADDTGSGTPAASATGELRRFGDNFSDGWTQKNDFPAGTWQLKQVDHFFNLKGTARYSHRQFYNIAYGHGYAEADFCDATTEINESIITGVTNGVWLKITTPVERVDSSADTLIDQTEPFELFLQGAYPINNKAIAVGKHFFLGLRSWTP